MPLLQLVLWPYLEHALPHLAVVSALTTHIPSAATISGEETQRQLAKLFAFRRASHTPHTVATQRDAAASKRRIRLELLLWGCCQRRSLCEEGLACTWWGQEA